jgi:hypothetical protein
VIVLRSWQILGASMAIYAADAFSSVLALFPLSDDCFGCGFVARNARTFFRRLLRGQSGSDCSGNKNEDE